jgi:GT2 family glycosyltransferase
VNNRSTDGTLSVVERYRGRIGNLRVVDALDKPGRAYARNVGVRAAQGAAVAFTDADDVVSEGWVRAMGEALQRHDFVACRMDDELLNTPEQRRNRGNNQRDGLQPYRYPAFLPHAGGSSLGMKRWLFEQVGGFDEEMTFLQDTDLCWKVQLSGYPLVFVPEATLHVRYRGDARALFRQARNFGEYNWVLCQRYRPLGMPPISPREELRGWLKVWRTLLGLPRHRNTWSLIWQFAWRLGRLQGMLRYALPKLLLGRVAPVVRPPRILPRQAYQEA